MNVRSLLVVILLAWSGVAFGQSAQLLEKQNVVVAAKPKAEWTTAEVGQQLAVNDRLRTGELSRALVRLTSQAMLRLNELTNITILPPDRGGAGPGLDLLNGAAYFLSRERPDEIRVRTPTANGILRGTEFHLAHRGGKTTLVMFEGEVEIGNAIGRVTARSGEQVEIAPGQAPRKTAVIEAKNIIQWCLYYPGVVQLDDLPLTRAQERALADSLAAYRAGDLPGALRAFPGEGAVASPAGRVYTAAIYLTAGQVPKAQHVLDGVPRATPGAEALRTLIAAVKFEELSLSAATTASDWLAHSYYQQSRSRLEAARTAARKATELRPESGYAWTRLAELEFSFGRVREAQRALEKGRAFTPRNAHAASLGGFLLSAENRIATARQSFEEAIALDQSYGNAWLGRGLTRIRTGDENSGREDLQAAAALEPNRSLFRSYLGKAWSNAGHNPRAMRELDRAIELDANDPTPWLYRALQNKQENRLNTAVRDLEKSIELNDNRRLFRSQFLLDQDKAVRGSNLASIYQLNGMQDVAVREATRAVNADYASASAHLFLANSYNALRDPRRIVLRYETPFVSEQLLANLLSPVGAGPLSQYVSEQEYSKLFESDGLGLNFVTEYFSTGELREIGSIYGTFRNLSISLDTEYFYDNGRRPNHDTSRTESYAKLKLQLTPWDVLFFETSFQNLRSGDTRQLYDDASLVPTLRVNEEQEPGNILIGLRHEWAPGIHTLALAGRLASEFTLHRDDLTSLVLIRAPSDVLSRLQPPLDPGREIPFRLASFPFREIYDLDLEVGTAELQQIITEGPHTLVAGVRYQEGSFHVRSVLEDIAPQRLAVFTDPAARDDFDADFERLNVYLYETLRVSRALTLIGGVTFDRLTYPDHFREPPLRDDSKRLEHWSPKAGIIFEPTRWLRLRGAYAEAISGVSLDESTRLEPTQVAGFTQASRTLINESLAGSVSAARYKIIGAAAEAKLPTGTYAGLEWTSLKQEGERRIGTFDLFLLNPLPSARDGSGIVEGLDYEERALTATLNQLVGDQWSFGAAYRVTWSEFQGVFADLVAFPGASIATRESELHQLNLAANWNHESGLFARADALWTRQETDGFPSPPSRPRTIGEPGDSFWQLNAIAGYRLPRNRGEVSLGVLNLLDTDYELEPLSPYTELPHERTFVVRCRITF